MSNNNSKRGFLSTLLTLFIGIILGIVLLIGGIAGTGYWAYNNLKLNKINSISKKDIISAEYGAKTIKQLFAEISDISKNPDSLTLGKIESIFSIVGDTLDTKFPDGIISVKNGGVELLKLDLNSLKDVGLSSLTNKFQDALIITANLESLSTLGITLPDFPLINGGVEGQELYLYTQANKETEGVFNLNKVYSSYTEFYKRSGEAPNYTYVLAEESEVTSKSMPIFIKTNGLKKLPLIDAINGLTANLNFQTLALCDLEKNFGINLKTNGEYHPVLKSLVNIPINELSGKMNEEINKVALGDIVTLTGALKSLEQKRDIDGNLLYLDDAGKETTTVTTKIAKTTINDISTQVELIKFGELLSIKDTETNQILKAIKDLTINNVNEKIPKFTLDDVMALDGTPLAALKFKHNISGEILYYELDSAGKPIETSEIAESKKDAAKQYIEIKTLISDVGEQVKYVKLGSLLGVTPTSNKLLQSIQNFNIANLNTNISTLNLGDVIDLGTNPSSILLALKDTPISNLDTKISSLTMKEILGINETDPNTSKILLAIKNSTLSTIGNDVNNLKLDDVLTIAAGSPFESLVYKKDASGNPTTEKTKITEIESQIKYLTIGSVLGNIDTSNSILLALKDTPINNIDTKIKELTIQEIFEKDIYQPGTKIIKPGIWKYILEDQNGNEKTVKLLDMASSLTDVTTKISSSTLFQLKANGLIDTDDASLNKLIPKLVSTTYGGKKMGELRVTELVTVLVDVLNNPIFNP